MGSSIESQYAFLLEMDRVPYQARRPGPEDMRALNKSNTQYYPDSNLGKTRELFDRAQNNLLSLSKALRFSRARA